MNLADMRAAADRVADRLEAASAVAKPTGADWHGAYVARERARAARTVANAIAEIMDEERKNA